MIKKELSLPKDCEKAIHNHIMKDPRRECGGFLIGQLFETENGLIGEVSKIIPIQRYGSMGDFVFSADDMLDAVVKARHDNDTIIGTYHSHGSFDAFISNTDKKFLMSRRGKEFMLVVSPSTLNKVVIYKDEKFTIEGAILLSIPEGQFIFKPYSDKIVSNSNFKETSKNNKIRELLFFRINERYIIYTATFFLICLIYLFVKFLNNLTFS